MSTGIIKVYVQKDYLRQNELKNVKKILKNNFIMNYEAKVN